MKDETVQSYPLLRKENKPAYVSVMVVWAIVSFMSPIALVVVTGSLPYQTALVWAAVTAMLGMAIMFVSRLINLSKLAPGFRRLAQSERDPHIPAIWCPVLTAATNASVELATQLHAQDQA